MNKSWKTLLKWLLIPRVHMQFLIFYMQITSFVTVLYFHFISFSSCWNALLQGFTLDLELVSSNIYPSARRRFWMFTAGFVWILLIRFWTFPSFPSLLRFKSPHEWTLSIIKWFSFVSIEMISLFSLKILIQWITLIFKYWINPTALEINSTLPWYVHIYVSLGFHFLTFEDFKIYFH